MMGTDNIDILLGDVYNDYNQRDIFIFNIIYLFDKLCTHTSIQIKNFKIYRFYYK